MFVGRYLRFDNEPAGPGSGIRGGFTLVQRICNECFSITGEVFTYRLRLVGNPTAIWMAPASTKP